MSRLNPDSVNKLPREEAKKYFDDWSGDLRARLILIDLAEAVYVGPGQSETNAAVASMLHAICYLEDRIAYEMEPHPKGMMRLPKEAGLE